MTLVVIHDDTGRPCAWGYAKQRDTAEQVAEKQWDSYMEIRARYGEVPERGRMCVHALPKGLAESKKKDKRAPRTGGRAPGMGRRR